MSDVLSRWRQPAAVVLLVALALRTALGLVALFGGDAGVATVNAQSTAPSGSAAGDTLAIVIVALLVTSCLTWRPTRHARALGGLTLLIGGVSVLVLLASALVGLVAGETDVWKLSDFSGRVLGLLIAALPLAALALLMPTALGSSRALSPGRSTRGPARHVSAQPVLTDPAGKAEPFEVEDQPSGGVHVRDEHPTWPADEAAGAAWSTAGEAAAGAAASGWGTAEDSGWRPAAGDERSRSAVQPPGNDEPPRS